MMDEKKINIYTQGGPVINGGTFSNVEFVANKYVYNDNPKYSKQNEDIEDAMIVTDETPKNDLHNSSKQEIPDSVKECFRFPTEYVKQQVDAIVKDFYLDQNVNMAMIEVTLYDHGQLHKRNGHTAFVRALKDWGILSADVDITPIASGIASKLRNPFPTDGYKIWDKYYLNERNLCTNIGNRLPESMKYNR